jgi:transposase
LRKFKRFAIFADMKIMEGLTIREIAKYLSIQAKAVQKRLEAANIKPKEFAGRTAIYDKSALEAIRNVPGKGRPRKEPEAPVKAKKGRK